MRDCTGGGRQVQGTSPVAHVATKISSSLPVLAFDRSNQRLSTSDIMSDAEHVSAICCGGCMWQFLSYQVPVKQTLQR